jgi:carbon-monoxide dehydrogenase iron sulfur subunit
MKRVYVKEEACIGCGLCEVYCRIEHSESKDPVKAFRREIPRPLPRVRVERNVEISFPIQCRHCTEPWCVYSCLTGAMQREPADGSVIVDTEKCIGCWTCIVTCPFGALSRDLSKKTVIKCDLCPAQDMPVCVTNCPNEALTVVAD